MHVLRREFMSGLAVTLAEAYLLPVRASTYSLRGPLYHTAFRHTLETHARVEDDGTTYVWTGDIPGMWLRDSAVVALPYIDIAKGDKRTASLLRGILARQAKCILKNPYANAFRPDYRVFEEKFELDSLLYPIWFCSLYYEKTGDRRVFTAELHEAFELVLKTLRTEQRHATRSRYRHSELTNGGRGSPIAHTGMVWTAFRPSDDAAQYHYNIPANIFGVVAMRMLVALARHEFHDRSMAQNAFTLGMEIQHGIEKWGYFNSARFGKIYAYEVDGLGRTNLMDDANLPSLLSIPYFGYAPIRNAAYQRTRRFVLSSRNPYFFSGMYAEGIGSPHTPRNYVWPLALVMQALTTTNEGEADRCLRALAASDLGDHRLHESFHVDNPWNYTRADFAFPNALYTELVRRRRG